MKDIFSRSLIIMIIDSINGADTRSNSVIGVHFSEVHWRIKRAVLYCIVLLAGYIQEIWQHFKA